MQTPEKPPFDLCDRTFQFALRIVKVCLALEKKAGVGWPLSKQLCEGWNLYRRECGRRAGSSEPS